MRSPSTSPPWPARYREWAAYALAPGHGPGPRRRGTTRLAQATWLLLLQARRRNVHRQRTGTIADTLAPTVTVRAWGHEEPGHWALLVVEDRRAVGVPGRAPGDSACAGLWRGRPKVRAVCGWDRRSWKSDRAAASEGDHVAEGGSLRGCRRCGFAWRVSFRSYCEAMPGSHKDFEQLSLELRDWRSPAEAGRLHASVLRVESVGWGAY